MIVEYSQGGYTGWLAKRMRELFARVGCFEPCFDQSHKFFLAGFDLVHIRKRHHPAITCCPFDQTRRIGELKITRIF